MKSPKRQTSNQLGRAQWYPYYAGYSPEFVSEALQTEGSPRSPKRVLDPWNGSGTTTQIASEHGHHATGFDINPAMVIVARARMLGTNVLSSIPSLLDDICSKCQQPIEHLANEPLESWLTRGSARAIRSLDHSISQLLIASGRPYISTHLSEIETVSSLASFFYVALFRTLRRFLKGFQGSNPTWIKEAATAQARLRIREATILTTFRAEVLMMYAASDDSSVVKSSRPIAPASSTITLANSTALPTEDGAFDVVISSPPYCTRIDYVIKTKPELAILGYDEKKLRLLRDSMLGTPTIPNGSLIVPSAWGESSTELLERISSHNARASKSYYWKTYLQYFDGLSRSIKEIARVLAPGGSSFLVVQDSYYKDLHVDLATIADEMATEAGLSAVKRFDFRASRSMAGLNSAARGYNSSHRHVESILVWRKPKIV